MKQIIFFLLISFSGFSQNDTITLTVSAGAAFRKSIDDSNNIYKKFDYNTKVLSIGNQDGFVVCQHEGITGYIPEYWILRNENYNIYEKRISDTKEKVKKELEQKLVRDKITDSLKILNDKKEVEKSFILYKNLLYKKYGAVIGKRILENKYWIGMTKTMAKLSLGDPSDINRTVTKKTISEQWVYYNRIYLYFTDGVVTSFQD